VQAVRVRAETARVPPELAPAFRALEAAVVGGEDARARRVLAGILARGPTGDVLELARAFERVLDGRDLVRSLDLRLALEPDAEREGRMRVLLFASHGGTESLRLRLPPGSLEHLVVAVDARGIETRDLGSRIVDAVEELVLAPGRTRRVELARYSVPLGRALAARDQWRLRLRSGEVEVAGAAYPAADPSVAPCERTLVAAFLPSEPIEPAELARYLRATEELWTPALVERAVRIAPERREEALDLLAPVVRELAASDPERVAAATPALRWLARTGAPGRSAREWSRWLALRAEPAVERPDLDLPAVVPGPGDEE
jgi:hypothetical protein